MKIKRFFAEDIRQAMRMVKEELGADAVIMSNKAVDGGVEIVAARDFDEQAIQSKLQKEPGQASVAPQNRGMDLPDFEAEKNRLHVLASQRKQNAEGFVPERPAVQPYQFPTDSDIPTIPGGRRNIDQYVGYAEKVHLRGNLETVPARPVNNPARPAANAAPRPNPGANTRPVVPTQAQQRPQPVQKPAQMARPAVKQSNPADNLMLEMGNEIKSLRSALDSKLANDNWPRTNPSPQPNNNANTRPQPAPQQRPQPVERPTQIAMPGIKPATATDDLLLEMGRELKSLRSAMDSKLSTVSWAHTTQAAPTNPVRIDLLKRLAGMSISRKLSIKIANRFANHTNSDVVFNQVQELLAKVLPVANDELLEYGGIAALVGPTGVGKTTTITKLAARFILKHGPGQVALITTDNYRIGAHEQLGIYGRILDVPVRVASSAAELHHLINGFADKRLILIDTAGMSQRDMKLVEQINTLQQSGQAIKTYLVMSAATEYKAMNEIIKSFQIFEPQASILTKLDETVTVGSAISSIIEYNLPLSFITDGQQVPEDMHNPCARTLVAQCVAELETDSDYNDANNEVWAAQGYA